RRLSEPDRGRVPRIPGGRQGSGSYGGAAADRRAARVGESDRRAQAPARRLLGRHEAAHRHRPGVAQRSQAADRRRADGGPRSRGAGEVPQSPLGAGRRAHRHPLHPYRVGRGSGGERDRDHGPRPPARPRRARGAAGGGRGEGLGVGAAERGAAGGARALEDRQHGAPQRRRARAGGLGRAAGACRHAARADARRRLPRRARRQPRSGGRAGHPRGGVMSMVRVLWHLLRADFLERVRRYSFLVTLAATVWLGWLVGTGKLGIWIGEARGVFNSAWIGTTMAMVINTFLSLAAFYVVKGSVDRDRQTGVGQILATTPITKPLYCLGKAAS